MSTALARPSHEITQATGILFEVEMTRRPQKPFFNGNRVQIEVNGKLILLWTGLTSASTWAYTAQLWWNRNILLQTFSVFVFLHFSFIPYSMLTTIDDDIICIFVAHLPVRRLEFFVYDSDDALSCFALALHTAALWIFINLYFCSRAFNWNCCARSVNSRLVGLCQSQLPRCLSSPSTTSFICFIYGDKPTPINKWSDSAVPRFVKWTMRANTVLVGAGTVRRGNDNKNLNSLNRFEGVSSHFQFSCGRIFACSILVYVSIQFRRFVCAMPAWRMPWATQSIICRI